MTNIKDCPQTKCAYNKANGGEGFCPVCISCKSPSNIIDEDCVDCWNCSKDEGIIRKGLPKFMMEKIKALEKEQDKLEKELIIVKQGGNENDN